MTESVGDTSLSLIDRARHREPEAWKRLVRLYGPVVFRWCRYRFELTEADAQDVGQEVFAAVHGALGEFRRDRQGDSFRGWLWTITRNKVRDHARRKQGHPPIVGGADHDAWLRNLPEPGDENDTGLTDEGSVCRRALEFIRNEFESTTWQAFWRTAVDGQPAPDVAVELEMKPGAVRKAKSRVLARLRQELDGLVDLP